MRALGNADLLRIWECGAGLHALDRGLLALTAALPDAPSESLADWTLGQRNRALAELHLLCFGPTLAGWLACSRCQEKLEFAMNASAIAASGINGRPAEPPTIFVNGHTFRLPTSRDLASVATAGDNRSAAVQILDRCRVGEDESCDWSDDDVEEIGRALAEADPLAEIRLSMRCPSCGNEASESLDIVAFLWEEIEGRAKRLLFEIDAIARAYGWTEKEILSLSNTRRALYVQMVQT